MSYFSWGRGGVSKSIVVDRYAWLGCRPLARIPCDQGTDNFTCPPALYCRRLIVLTLYLSFAFVSVFFFTVLGKTSKTRLSFCEGGDERRTRRKPCGVPSALLKPHVGSETGVGRPDACFFVCVACTGAVWVYIPLLVGSTR